MGENMRLIEKWGKPLSFLIVFLLSVLMVNGVSNAVYEYDKKHVLILHSYHEGFTWTQEVNDGLISTLKNGYFNLDISVEYLDWKEYPYQENLDALSQVYAYKYQNKPIDVIITTDDAALDFALKNRGKIFTDAPIVFCGVNEVGRNTITAGYTNYTGIIEQVDIEETIKLAIETMPGLERIYMVYDNTESGYSTG